MELKKNDICTIEIIDMNHDGEGIGKADGCPLFVKDAIIGDIVRVKIMKMKKNYGYARLEEILTPSPDRVSAACSVARQCGGCQLQVMDYKKQLEFKQNKVANNLKRIGRVTDYIMEPIIGMENPLRYRNKAQFPVGKNKDGRLIAGFYAGHTHSIIENEDCLLGAAENKDIIDIVLRYMEDNHIEPYDELAHNGMVRHIFIRKGFFTGEIMVCLVCNGKKLPSTDRLIETLRTIPGMTGIFVNVNRERTNAILGDELIKLWGKDYITDTIGDIAYHISPMAFYQVNPVQTVKLYGKALEYAGLTGSETVWDIYCGIGTISLFLARNAKKVYGIEIIPEAIENARENAKLNNIENTEFFVGKAEEVLPKWYADNKCKADVVVVDPPRKGCDEAVLKTMVAMEPERIVYVSCDSATLARDIARLGEMGYKCEKVCATDMFPNGVHVETVVLLSKGEVDSKKVRVEFSLEDMDMSDFQDSATYTQIKDYVLEHSGLKVSNLYISQIKRKCGIEVGKNYNLPKSEDSRQPQCPPEKEKAIREAFEYFGLI